MKNFYILLLVLFTISANSQTVTTYLNSPDATVDDDLVLDSQGNLYGSNFYGGNVYKITPDGSSSLFVSGLIYANGLAVDSEDNVYVNAYLEGSINKYDSDGNLLQIFPIGDGYPSGLIKAYKSDNMVFTDVGDNSIKELSTTDGTVSVLTGGEGLLNIPVGIVYGPKGDLYIGNYIGREIYRLPAKGGDLEYVATVPAPNNYVPYLAFIAYAQGSLYGTVYGEHKIYKINPRNVDDVEIYSGSVFGNTDGHLSEVTYAFPAGILANQSGNTLYVSEFDGNGNIRKITNGNAYGNNSRMVENTLRIETYPNPATDYINIVSHSDSEKKSNNLFDIKLYSISTGLEVLSQEAVDINGKYSLSLIGLQTGLYELIISNDEAKKSSTIVINRK
ncbi:T9SS type A sorting domain-containing protein [Xanthomarina spongicola]|uniref:Putative secreted protein (Por secretion system target) n=1 Tax=Xanthomarina spongicola TaxID=570520 RepID=A0A316DP30_9FLAO|nr:T9SS type A sorting domain-containing protein [Xanthomarina spongicola]PWK19695.1 putative secreted protein (Por secretion system target) [Xanthomarina spongicola]